LLGPASHSTTTTTTTTVNNKPAENGATSSLAHAISRHRVSYIFLLARSWQSLFSNHRNSSSSTQDCADQTNTADALPLSHLHTQSDHLQNAHAVSVIFFSIMPRKKPVTRGNVPGPDGAFPAGLETLPTTP